MNKLNLNKIAYDPTSSHSIQLPCSASDQVNKQTKASEQTPDLGSTLRSHRQEKGYTLDQVAQLTGIAKSTISKIENNQTSPSFETLQQITQGLNIHLPQLFERVEDKPKPYGRLDITRGDKQKLYSTQSYDYQQHSDQIANKKLSPRVLTIKARSTQELNGWIKDDGEGFLYVLQGSIILYSEFYEPITLHKGDSTYYDCNMGHNFLASGEDTARVLWVVS